jgi:hypothetical protein
VLIPLTQISQLPEQDSTLLRREVPPFGARLESRAGGRDGGVDVFLAGGFDGCDEGFVVGVDGFDLLARGGGDELVVDEQAFYSQELVLLHMYIGVFFWLGVPVG